MLRITYCYYYYYIWCDFSLLTLNLFPSLCSARARYTLRSGLCVYNARRNDWPGHVCNYAVLVRPRVRNNIITLYTRGSYKVGAYTSSHVDRNNNNNSVDGYKTFDDTSVLSVSVRIREPYLEISGPGANFLGTL